MSKKYENAEIYPMVTLVLHYPEAGHNGRQFWTSMINTYEDSIPTLRNAGALREKWRKIAKNYPTNLEEYKKKLIDELPKQFVDKIEGIISKKLAEPNPNPISGKRRSAPLPNIFKGEGIQKIKLDNGEEGKLLTKKTGAKKPSLGRIRIGHAFTSLEDIRTCLDLNSITARKAIGISKTIKKCGSLDVDIDAKEFLSKRNENTPFIQGLIQLTKEVEPNLGLLPKLPTKPLEQLLKGEDGWNELEDMALRCINIPEVQDCLIKMKGIAAVEERKKLLGI